MVAPVAFPIYTCLALFLACPLAWWAIGYDFGRNHEWPMWLKWSFILTIILLFTASTALDAQMVSDVNWCGQAEGWWWYAIGCFL